MAKRVYLSPSDQRRNTYAVGDTTEAIQCGRIAEACKAALERSGVEVMLGQYDTMQNRVAASNRFKADLHVPIHSNACNGKATGTRLFCYSADKNSAGYKACKAVMDVLGPITPGAPDIIKAYPALYEIKYPAAPAVYIETDFHDVPRIAQWIIDNTAGHRGVDAVIDAVGFEAKGSLTETVLSTLKIEGSSGKALRQCIAAVRRGGIVSVPGVYAGFIHGFMFGDAFDKGLTFRMGQTHVHAWLPDLLALIEQGLLTPEEIVTHHMPLEEAARGYQIFEKREEACRKVILVPGMQPGKATL